MTDNARKVQENRCRRMAARQGMQFVKERRPGTSIGWYRLLGEDTDDQGDEGFGWYSKTRRNREMYQYGRDEIPRASALATAFLAHNVTDIHAVGPAEPDDPPTGWGFDVLDYQQPRQVEFNRDHYLPFAFTHILWRLARECGMPAEAFYDFLERQRAIPTDPKTDERPPDGLRVVVAGTLDRIEEFLSKGEAKVR